MTQGLLKGDDGLMRCHWHGGVPEYIRYHDEEWGRPVREDVRLFEKMSLEGFQAGLSWLTILRKRENFRRAFADFDFAKIAKFSERDIERLMQDSGIIRHRGKIEAVINNAQKLPAVIAECGSFAAYLWSFEPKRTGGRTSHSDIPGQVPESLALSKDLKKRGFKFVGPTTMYALIQAMGMVNDHLQGCCCHGKIETLRQDFKRP